MLGFEGIAPSFADRLTVPPGYTAQVLAAWGDPVGLPGRTPAFRFDASNSAQEQEAQMGMHHDGMQFYALPGEGRGLLAVNHEYTDDGLLHPGGMARHTRANPQGVDLMCATLSELAPPLDMILPDVTVIDLTATSSLQRPVELLFEEAEALGMRLAAGKVMKQTDVELEKMNYLVEGVVGKAAA